MRVLILACDYPPIRSPQAIRWASLAGGLAEAGSEVRVIAPGESSEPAVPGVFEVRTAPGWVHACVRAIRRRGGRREGQCRVEPSYELPLSAQGLNWRGFVAFHAVRLLSLAAFPDVRGQWNSIAIRHLREQIASFKPDVVITSHEPASVLLLGSTVRDAGIAWVADLGDPIVASYTPTRWLGKARRVERMVASQASLVLTTTRSLARDLKHRYPRLADRLCVIRQGYGFASVSTQRACAPASSGLSLVYSGQLYRFRPILPLLEAVAVAGNISLDVICPVPTPELMAHAQDYPDRIRVHTGMEHSEILDRQRNADILVNIGNDLPLQMPGKLFEYFGACRPVLHLFARENDESCELIHEASRGWCVANNRKDIAEVLAGLAAERIAGSLASTLDLSPERISQFSWSAISARLAAALDRLSDRAQPEIS